MQVHMYAVRQSSVRWALRISLDIRMDLEWWANNNENGAIMIWLLSEAIPLGWAVMLRDQFVTLNEMDTWSTNQWIDYVRLGLKHELKYEMKSKDDSGNVDKRQKGGASLLLDGVSPYVLWQRTKGITSRGRLFLRRIEERGAGDSVLSEPPNGLERMCNALEGRSLLQAELQQLLAERLPELAPAWRSAIQHAHLQGRVQLTAGVALAAGRQGRGPLLLLRQRARPPRCRRCGSEVHRRTPCGSCGLSGCAYCEACLALGRSRSCALLLRGNAVAIAPPAGGTAAQAMPPTASLLDRWGLSPAQRAATGSALRFLASPPSPFSLPSPPSSPMEPNTKSADEAVTWKRPPSGSSTADSEPSGFLLWAVTGAGKTEMIFPLIQYILAQGGKVLVATPRRDVVLELAPRMIKAFPNEEIAVLYGGSSQRWDAANLILSTTHQLLRFYRFFDLVIIDELDAFPYHNDPLLAFAAKASCKLTGKFIYLSATPPRIMQNQVKSGQLAHAKVPARFHGYPLPVPKHISMNRVEDCIRKGTFSRKLKLALAESVGRGAQVFIFVSRIRHIDPTIQLLQKYFPEIRVDGTSSQDDARGDKVVQFRSTAIRILVTTTILERGVTVPKSDVYILDADSGLFDEASLVQMAGRAGRSKDDPCGTVWFASSEWTSAQRRAISQIRSMNRVAERSGFLQSKVME